MFKGLCIILISGFMGSVLSSAVAQEIQLRSVQSAIPKLFKVSGGDFKVNRMVQPKDVIKVMVIDTGIDKHKRYMANVQYVEGSDDYVDNHGHGTHITGILLYGNHMWNGTGEEDLSDKLCNRVQVYSCKYYDPKKPGPDNLNETIKCIERATKEGMNYINYSGGGTEYSQREYDAYKKFVDSGGVVIAAAGNERSDIIRNPYYPASYGIEYKLRGTKVALKNFIIVQNVDRSGKLVSSSNWFDGAVSEMGQNVFSYLPGDSAGYMTGTSQAAPAALHNILKQKCNEGKLGFTK